MLILVIRTDRPESEIGLYEDSNPIEHLKWLAHLELAETIHKKVSGLLERTNKGWHELSGLVVYKGPGSFTGLRIGIAFANTLAYSLDIPIIGSTKDSWVNSGIKQLLNNKNEKNVTPEYGIEAHITLPKK
jgi:tRNA threonylcarbamoyladenosine biosynthesis protein TsaB